MDVQILVIIELNHYGHCGMVRSPSTTRTHAHLVMHEMLNLKPLSLKPEHKRKMERQQQMSGLAKQGPRVAHLSAQVGRAVSLCSDSFRSEDVR